MSALMSANDPKRTFWRCSGEEGICATLARDEDIKRAELAIRSVRSHISITGMRVSGPSLPSQHLALPPESLQWRKSHGLEPC